MREINWQPGVTLEDIELQVIDKAYRFFEGNKTKTANALGIAIRTLDNKLSKMYGSKEEETKDDGNTSSGRVHLEPNDKISQKQTLHVRERDKIQKVSSK